MRFTNPIPHFVSDFIPIVSLRTCASLFMGDPVSKFERPQMHVYVGGEFKTWAASICSCERCRALPGVIARIA